MSLVRAIAISSALHAATLFLAGGTVGTTAGPPRAAALPLTVDLTFVERPGPASSPESVAVVETGQHQPQAEPLPPAGEPASRTEADTPGVVLPTYFPISALTRLPEPLTNLDALISRQAEPQPGNLELAIWLSSDGLVDKVEVLRSEVPDGMTRTAVDAFARMRFRPGEIRGTPVRSRAEIVVQFAPDTRQPVPAENVTRTQVR